MVYRNREYWKTPGQPHQVAGSYGITGQADYDGGVQLVVFVQLFVQGFIFGIIFVTDGDIQLVGPGLLSFPLVEGDFRSFALFAQVFPDKAVKHGPPVQDVDADFAHDAFYHPAGGEVIGFVYVARNVGILCQQLLVGIIHSAEYDGYSMKVKSAVLIIRRKGGKSNENV